MITKFEIDAQGFLIPSDKPAQNCVWIDMVAPTQEEYDLLEDQLHIKFPRHHEMLQLEYSNRFYEEDQTLFLSASVVTKISPNPESQVISFIVSQRQVITVRFSDPSPIKSFIEVNRKHPHHAKLHSDVLYLLLDSLLGRAADIYEFCEEKTELLTLGLYGGSRTQAKITQSTALQETLNDLIQLESVLSKCYQSLSSLQLLMGFYKPRHDQLMPKGVTNPLDLLHQDIKAMMSHGEFLSQKLGFQLESTLGLININQTQIIKTFTVLAMIFMPPTLVASIYGMNFKHMPELNLTFGYPIAIMIMLVSALLPYLYFKRKKWL